MNISPEASFVLGVLNSFEHNKTLSTLETIRTQNIWVQQGNSDQNLTEVLGQLLDSGLISFTEGAYSLTRQGLSQVKQFMSEGFSAIIVAEQQSATSRKFCEQVFGTDLRQLNSMSMTQFNKMLEVMNLSENDHILDLGCGSGLISEYISDLTGANVVGVDFATGAIEHAQERTQKKRGRLSYQIMDMDELSFPKKSFSGVISIDAIHFVNNLKRAIQLAKECLRDNGQMGIFYSVTLSEGEPIDNLEPEQTPLGKVLQECELNFQTWDYTQDEKNIWEKVLRVAEELKQEYEKEEKLYLYEMAVADARPMLDAIKIGRRSRYLYHIR
jgi:cyclopropane fatty-acyl-phospholipid synthase-like methyltransferase